MTHDDPVRPDLDAAIDAAVPALTAVDANVAAASERRTLLTLRETTAPTGGMHVWTRRVAATGVLAAAGIAAMLFWIPPDPVVDPLQPVLPSRPLAVARASLRPDVPARSVSTTSVAAAVSLNVRDAALNSRRQGAATPRRADPLLALVRAMAAIPEDAWQRGMAATAGGELTIPDVPIAPLVVAPFDIPPVADAPSAPASPGELR